MNRDNEILTALLELRKIRRDGMRIFYDLEDVLSNWGDEMHGRADHNTHDLWVSLNDLIYSLQTLLCEELLCDGKAYE